MSDPDRWEVFKEFLSIAVPALLRPLAHGIVLTLVVSPAAVLAFAARYILTNYTATDASLAEPAAGILGVFAYVVLLLGAILAHSTWQDAKENVAEEVPAE